MEIPDAAVILLWNPVTSSCLDAAVWAAAGNSNRLGGETRCEDPFIERILRDAMSSELGNPDDSKHACTSLPFSQVHEPVTFDIRSQYYRCLDRTPIWLRG